MPETEIVDVDEDFVIPKGAYAYKIEGESGMNYIGGKVYTKEEIRNLPDDGNRVLKANAEQFKGMICTRLGNWQPFDPDKDHHVTMEELAERNFVEEL